MDGKRKQQANASRGFTLMEILVVLVLMSLILAISTVFFANTLPKAKQRAAVREIASTIKYARHLAVSNNQRQEVTFDLDTGRYGVAGRAERTIPDETRLVIYTDDINADPVQKGRYIIYYDATGTSNWSEIQLVRGKRTLRIEADPLLTAVIASENQDTP